MDFGITGDATKVQNFKRDLAYSWGWKGYDPEDEESLTAEQYITRKFAFDAKTAVKDYRKKNALSDLEEGINSDLDSITIS